METKYLYVFRSREGFYKIGISGNVESRLSSIRTSNHDNVEIVIARKLKDALGFEQELHRKYDLSRKSGEWFRLTAEEVIDICVEINLADGERPAIENKPLEKIITSYAKDHKEIKAGLVFLKEHIMKMKPEPKKELLPTPPTILDLPKKTEEKNDDGSLVERAIDVVRREQRASTSLLQRKLSIGYARAARIMDRLEERNVVGPNQGAKSREVVAR